MSYVFIGGIPASGKSYLAKKVAEKTGAFHLDVDTLRKEMSKDPQLKYWVNFFFNQDEEEYLKNTPCEKHWENLVKQSEAFWPTILNKINEVIKSHKSAIFEGVNILPHLAKRDFNFPGVYLLGKSFEEIFERNKQDPRWGQTEQLQKLEAELFFNCERPKYKEEAEKYGYKIFDKSDEAEEEVLKLLGL
ncbi:MAG: AAA family ATPase [Candidatus Daviesbacteria bacterium]|nr:MAG: AAA family ATPase [Candidatus Daviesbacteria bacterium]